MSGITNERGLEAAFHEVCHRPPFAVAWKLQDAFSSGIPDRIVCIGGRTTWVELKYVAPHDFRKKTYDFKTGLRPEQRRRMREWAQAGGRAFMLLGCTTPSETAQWMFLVEASKLPGIEEHVTMSGLEDLAQLSGPLTRDGLRFIRDSILAGDPSG